MSDELAFVVDLAVPPDQAIERVTAALKTEGFGVLTRIDVHSTLKEKLGVDMPPYTILGVCNPPIAHRALGHDPRVGLLLPCNVTVEWTRAGARVRIGNPKTLMDVGPLRGDPVLQVLAVEAHDKLSRVAGQLRAG